MRFSRMVLLALAVGLAALPVLSAPGPLKAKRDLVVKGAEGYPTDVALDSQGYVYVLYNQQGFLDILNPQGERIQHRGGMAEKANAPDRIIPINQWVGRFARSLVLASEAGQRTARWVLHPVDGRLAAVELKGAPEELTGNSVVARDPDGRILVLHQGSKTLYVFGGSSGTFLNQVSMPELDRPTQLAVGPDRKLHILDNKALHVLTLRGEPVYRVEGANAFYLTGAGVLAVAGDGWVRRFSRQGVMELEVLDLAAMKGRVPAAISLTDTNSMFLYLREPVSGAGLTLKLDKTGYPTHEFLQPVRFPASPDPGFRLDYEGRLHYWDRDSATLLKVHPGGKVERALKYTRAADDLGRMVEPADMVVDKQGTVWIADTGNLRLQRFNLDQGGWLETIPVGIRGGPRRAVPRQLTLGPDGSIHAVVHPPDDIGEVVLQRRDSKGKLLTQKPLGDAAGKPTYKLAVAGTGDVYVYRVGGSPASRDHHEYPVLTHYNPRGVLVKKVGGEDQNFHYPKDFTSRIHLGPFEDMLPWKGGLLVPTGGKFLIINPNLEVTGVRELMQRRGSPGGDRLPGFAGSAIFKGVLYVTDTVNRSVHVVPLEP
ncbi:MAG: hypothetical protein HY319_01905 [Armatimonadetes bacterium]|nr:hypothetical protein [Armatimonadota bacterium]